MYPKARDFNIYPGLRFLNITFICDQCLFSLLKNIVNYKINPFSCFVVDNWEINISKTNAAFGVLEYVIIRKKRIARNCTKLVNAWLLKKKLPDDSHYFINHLRIDKITS